MKSQVLLGLVMVFAGTVAPSADDSIGPWGRGLPIVEATKTEVGPGKYLWGSTLLLAIPDKFQGYWPDYGYRWSNAAYVEMCGSLGKTGTAEGPNLGRVRLVAETGSEAERLIGVELRRDREQSEETPNGESPTPADKGEFTVGQLCALLSDDRARRRIESVVGLIAKTGVDVLKTGTWHGKTLDVAQDLGGQTSEYMLLWMGWGVEEGLDPADKVRWFTGGKPVIVWDHPSEVKLRPADGKSAPIVFAFHEQPGYMLTQMGGVMDVAVSGKPASFQVNKGVVGTDFLAATKLQPTNLHEVIFGVWADVAKYEQFLKPMNFNLWLVTENAIPKKSLVPEIRVGESR